MDDPGRASRSRHLHGGRLRGRRRRRRRSASCRRPGVRTSPTPTTWSRRSPGSSATTRCRRCSRGRPTGRGLTRTQRLRRRIGRIAGRCRLRRGGQLPVRRRRGVRPRSGCPPTTARRRTVRLANPLSSEEPAYTTTLLPGLLEAAARNLGRGAPGVALFETGTVAFPVDRGPTPIYGVDWRPDRGRARQDARHHPRAAAAPGRRARRRAGALRLVGERPRGRLVRRDRAGTPPRRRARRSTSTSARRRTPRGTRVAAPRCFVGRTPRSGTPASCTRRSAGRSACPARSAAVEIDLDVLMAHAPEVVGGPDVLDLPGRQGGRRARRRRRGDRRPRSRPRCARAPATLLESVRLFDVYTGAQVGDGPQVAGLRAALPGARPHAHRGRGGRRPRRRGRAGRRAVRCRPALSPGSVERLAEDRPRARRARPGRRSKPDVRRGPGRGARARCRGRRRCR